MSGVRNEKGRFVKGQSGNPTGRPKLLAEIQELTRSYGKEAIEKLVSLMRSAPTPNVQFSAAKEILERGFGKSSQLVELSDGEQTIGLKFIDGPPQDSSFEAWMKRRKAQESGS